MTITKEQFDRVEAAIDAWNAKQNEDENCTYPNNAMSLYLCTGDDGGEGSIGSETWEESTKINVEISVWAIGGGGADALPQMLRDCGLPVDDGYDFDGDGEGTRCFGYRFTPDHTYELFLHEEGEDPDGPWFWCEVVAPNGASYSVRLHKTADGWENRADLFSGNFPDDFDFDILTDAVLQRVYELPNHFDCVSINIQK